MAGKYVVCPRCSGEGFVSKIGAFTGSDLDEWFGDGPERDEFLDEYRRPGGAYDETCPCCKGNRVATRKQITEWREWEADMRVMAQESGYMYGY